MPRLVLAASGALALLVAACVSAAPSRGTVGPTGHTPSGKAGAGAQGPSAGVNPEQPVRGGTLRYALSFEPSNFSPITGASYDAHLVFHNVYDTLVFLDPEGQFRAGLATDWQISADGREYTFSLRRDVTFHDGTPFDAEAVKFTFDLIANPETRSVTARDLLGPDYRVTEVVDAYTVRVRFDRPYAPFLAAVSRHWLAPISPTAYRQHGRDFGTRQVGTGPFRWHEYVAGERITLVRNEDYAWAPEGASHNGSAHLERVEFRFIPEGSVRTGTLESGEVQVAEDLPPRDMARLQGDAGFRLLEGQVPGLATSLFFNTRESPTDNVEVRRALNYALDKEALSRTMFAGLSQPAYSVLAPTTAGYSAESEMYRASVERARGLLDQAGWTPGADGVRTKDGARLSLTIKTLGFNRYPEILQVVQAQWREVGVESRIEQVNIAQLREALNQDEVHVAVNFMPSPDPYVLGLSFHSRNMGDGFNYARVADPTLDRLLDEAVSEMDEARRMDLYAQAQQLIMKQALVAPLYAMPHNTVARAEVRGLVRDRAGWDTLLHGVWLEQTRR